MAAAFGTKARWRSERLGTNGPRLVSIRSGTYRRRNTHTTASSRTPAIMRNPA
jgi:hypothetical protein